MSPSTLSPNFQIRLATTEDVPALAALFFTSFTPSHDFWAYCFPPGPGSEHFLRETFRLGIEDDMTRTFIVEDASATAIANGGSKKPVAFSRWLLPRKGVEKPVPSQWPPLLEEWDLELLGAVFGGMEGNRETLMEGRPHWFLELLGTDQQYQGRGIGTQLVKWGCDRADADGLECYLDASMKGAPFYDKHFGFRYRKDVVIPERPKSFDTYSYTSYVRPVKGL